MISLQRARDKKSVHKNFFGAKRIELNQLLMEQKLSGKLDGNTADKWDSNIWKAAKKQLLNETHDKCAYCETPTRVIAYGDVEHFRPKSQYWWLAYCYENYLAACTVCNQEYKKDLFDLRDDTKKIAPPLFATGTVAQIAPLLTPDPVDNATGKDMTEFENELLGEWALIVHPYMEDPAEYYAYEADIINKEVLVKAAKPEYADVLASSEKIFGINRLELRDLRFQWYCLYMTFRRTASVATLPDDIKRDNENRLAEMLENWSPYAGMIRYFHKIPLRNLPWDSSIRITPADLKRKRTGKRKNT